MRPDENNPDGDRPDSEPAGYGHPPRSSRFRYGHARKRGGRKKGAENRKTIIARVAHEKHPIMENGKRRRRSALELVLIFLRNSTAEGGVRAFRAYHDCLTRFGPQQSKKVGGYLIVPELLTVQEWEKASQEVLEYQQTLTWDP
jgi:hypothetical protein